MMAALLRLRFAACACLLAAVLLVGAGGAVAVADPVTSGSAANGEDGVNDQQHSPSAKKPKKVKDEPGATDTGDGSLGLGGQLGRPHSIDAEKPKDAKKPEERMSLAVRTKRIG